MTERAYRPKTHKELCDFVESLSARLDKIERNQIVLHSLVRTQKRKAQPAETFDDWWRRFKAADADIQRTLCKDLFEGVQS